MSSLRFIPIFLSLSIFSCRQSEPRPKIDPHAIELNNKIVPLVRYISNPDSCRKALSFLDSATNIDDDYYLGYFNKLMFLNKLKEYDKAILTTQNLIRLRPTAHDLYIIKGVFHEKSNDTVSSKSCFLKSLQICNSVLDTMKLTNSDYEMLVTNKAVNLIMLNRNNEANIVLKKLSEMQSDGEMKSITLSMLNISKTKLLEIYYSEQNSR